MISKLGDMNRIIGNFVNETMLVVDPTRPVTRKCVFEWLGFSDPLEWIPHGLFDEGIDATKDFFIRFLPVQVIIPGVIRENEFQSMRSLAVPSSFSSWDMDSIRRRVFFGERKRYAVSSSAL